jgi:hypothetical protein
MAEARVGAPPAAGAGGPIEVPGAGGWRGNADVWAEAVTGLGLLVVILWLVAGAWHVYDAALRPYAYARTAGEQPPERPPHVRADDPAAVRRLQQVTNLLGEANTYREAGKYEWAEVTLRRALEVDPTSREALETQARWGLEFAATPPPQTAPGPDPAGPGGYAAESDPSRGE